MIRTVAIIANSGFTVLNFRRELIKSLVSKQVDVFVVCPSQCQLMGGKDVNSELQKIGANHVPVSMNRSGVNPLADIKYLVDIALVLKRISPDLVLNYTIKPSIYGSIAARFACGCIVSSNITGIGHVFTSETMKSRLLATVVKLQYKVALKANSVVFFQNIDDRDFFLANKLVQKSKAKLINGSGVDTNKYIKINSNPRPKSFIFVGRLLQEKGVLEYISAAKLVQERYPESIFAILGGVDENPTSLSFDEIKKHDQDGTIEYLGTTDNVCAILNEFEVFVLPSYREGTPRSTLEALSIGMPVITTDSPGCRETVVDGVNGFIVEPQSASAIAKACFRFLETPNIIQRFGKESRKIACNRYDVAKVNSSILDSLFHLE